MAADKTFGGFFRSKRKALSPTMAEFCRRNGFDKGNISRLERGITLPPQSEQILESYAKALKLEEGTAERERFFALAAAETGRIPAAMLGGQPSAHKLPTLLRQLRPAGQCGWVRARHLEAWADTLDARGGFPELLRRLIKAAGKDIRSVSFPAEEQTARPEWDGIVEAAAPATYVPEGTSVWELGVDQDYRAKFTADLAKRTKSPLGLDPAKTTFVFATPRKWQASGRAKRNVDVAAWKEVRIYDGAILEEWLEQSPAVDAWLAARIGLRPQGVISVDEYWENLQALTQTPLKPEVFLASRQDQVNRLAEWLDGPPAALTIETRSPAEAIDFVVAYSRQGKHADLFVSRALIVDNREAWRNLAMASDAGLLLIAHPSLVLEPELVAEAVRKGKRVLLPSTHEPREQVATLRLARTYPYDLEQALESSGMDRLKARKRARESGASLTVLKRVLGQYQGTAHPAWATPHEARQFMPLLLAGAWDESSDADRGAIERLADRPYSDVAETVARWIKEADAPLVRRGTRVGLVSRDDSWFLLASSLRADDVGRFETVALDVLAEDDPVFDRPPEKRWEASLLKKGPRYSPALRGGLAETLALLGSRPEKIPGAASIPHRVGRIVRTLLDGGDSLRWASLSYQLPLLAEAAPQAFLDAVDKDLRQPQPVLTKLFAEGGDVLFSSMPHAGLLWALEVLSWNRDLLPQTALMLAVLEETMPKSRAGNAPLRSLTEIFMSWFPQTTAPVEERMKVLARLIERRPGAGWRLLVALLPNRMAMVGEIQRPAWRDWALPWSAGVSQAEYWHQVNACAALLVKAMGDDVGRWTTLIKQFENLPGPSGREFLAQLRDRAASASDGLRREVSEAIRQKVAHHRQFAKANRALPEARLRELEGVQREFEPQDAAGKHAWLFGSRWQLLDRFDNDEDRMEVERRTVVEQILGSEKWDGILRLIDAVETSEEVGGSVAALASPELDAKILPAFLTTPNVRRARFVEGYLKRRFHGEGWEWVHRLPFADWSVEQIGWALVILPFEQRTWDIVETQSADVEAWYWQHAGAYLRGDNLGDDLYAIRKLLEHERASAAFHVIRMALHHKHALQPALLMDVLEGWLDVEMPKGDARSIEGVKYDIDLVFKELHKAASQDASAAGMDRLARLEWRCLALLDGYPSSPIVLHRRLQEDAAFFVDLLALCFRPKGALPKPESELTAQAKIAAQNGYRLLMDWKNIPGQNSDDTFDENRLAAWVSKARELARARGLLDICESEIGSVLAHCPERAGGSWPAIAVRDVLEDIGTEAVFDGFSVGIYNKRGTWSKSPREGGAQERALAEKYRRFAEDCRIDWPKTAQALRKVALGYEHDAAREDLEAEIE
jgi:hypothetical protein